MPVLSLASRATDGFKCLWGEALLIGSLVEMWTVFGAGSSLVKVTVKAALSLVTKQ